MLAVVSCIMYKYCTLYVMNDTYEFRFCKTRTSLLLYEFVRCMYVKEKSYKSTVQSGGQIEVWPLLRLTLHMLK